MSKTIVYIGMSLDGFIAGKNDDLSWLDPFQDVDYGYQKFFSTIGAVIKGKRSYDIEVAKGWENAHPVPTFVLAHTPPKTRPTRTDVVFTDEDISQVLEKAKEMTDKDIWIEGGAHVVQEFLNRGLVDELIVTIAPVFLGDGIRLFDNIDTQNSLSLENVNKFDKGLVQFVYKVNQK